ncbi:MAG: GDSL-type esterase/lipase family protein [Planctomycetota bacterium]
MSRGIPLRLLLPALSLICCKAMSLAAEPPQSSWTFSAEVLQPFWQGNLVDGESVLFIRDPESGIARGQLLFPIRKLIRITPATQWRGTPTTVFEHGRDYRFTPNTREIVLPAGSRIPSFTPDQLRRPPGSQKYRLTHRDGNGEILFGAADEYHQMQMAVTYEHAAEAWTAGLPELASATLPRSTTRLRERQPLSIVLLGDSISTGCNASGWAKAPPFQPPWQDLLLQHLQAVSSPAVSLTNLAVGGTSTPWGLTKIPDVLAAKPDLVLLAFGMNDASGRPAAEYKANVARMLEAIRSAAPDTEFILVAGMLGNADWTTLRQELFPAYRQALQELTGPGTALADLTSIWTEMLKRKRDWDLTGNGVNHPNDFGHRIYAQVLTSLLLPPQTPPAKPSDPIEVQLWPDKAPNGDRTFEQSGAKLTVHPAPYPNGAAVVICPGGGYGGLVTGPEGHGIAKWLNSHGIAGIVLEYRLPRGRSFVPLLDAQRALRIVRARATEWGIDSDRVGIMGFSAGGHLASTAATHFEPANPTAPDPLDRPSTRPDFAILVYPVVSMGAGTHSGSRKNLLGENPPQDLVDLFSSEKQVTANTPPMFLTHAVDDQPVPPEHSRSLYRALQAAEVPAKYLELPSGGHGLNGYQGPMWDAWQTQSLEWLKARHVY